MNEHTSLVVLEELELLDELEELELEAVTVIDLEATEEFSLFDTTARALTVQLDVMVRAEEYLELDVVGVEQLVVE